MSKLEVDTIAPQSGTTITVGEAGDTVDISNATLSANLNATNLTSGTIPDARFPATLPAVDGSQLTGVQIAGGYTICDSITVTNTDTFALTSGGSPVSPESAANCLVSLNGILQAPISSYTISGSNIIFASALVAGSDVIDFITVLGTALNIGTPSDGTVGLNKLSATGTKDATTFLRGDNTFIGVPIKKITVNDDITTQYSGLGGTVTNTLTDFNITHTALSTSNKLAFFISIPYYLTLGDYIGITRFKLNNGTSNVTPSLFYDYIGTQGNKEMSINASYFNLTPASTNAITYTVQIEIYRPQGTSTITIGQSDNPTRLMCVEY